MHTVNYIQFVLAFIFIISVMLMIGYAARRYGLGNLPTRRLGQKKRLQIIDTLVLDAKHRVFLIAQDDKEHLILTGPENDCIIEKNMPRKETPDDDTDKKK